MKEIVTNLYCGSEQDFYLSLLCTDGPVKSEMELLMCMPEGWAVVHACKEPFHRMALGYTSKGAPKEHPEYLWAERGNRLALNIVDAPKLEFFDKSMIDKALDFIDEKLNAGMKVLVHCNEGHSRSCSICLLYIISKGLLRSCFTLEDCEAEFMKVYPEYNPGAGIRGFMKEQWSEYIGQR
jgi:predicted protein tyrosine phosphatase